MASTDFFISYTGADQAWAEWIAETLERAGHSTVLQSWDFRPGENFIERMNDALVDAERVVAVLSPAYFRSEYARDEWTAAMVRDRGGGRSPGACTRGSCRAAAATGQPDLHRSSWR